MNIKLLLSVAIVTVSLNAADADTMKALDDGAGTIVERPLTPRTVARDEKIAKLTATLDALTGGGLNTAVGLVFDQRKAEFKGDAGANGLNGADGKDGAPGLNGTDGTDGRDGTDGANGLDGAPGQTIAEVLAAAKIDKGMGDWAKEKANEARTERKSGKKGGVMSRISSMRRKGSRKSKGSEAAMQDETVPTTDAAATELQDAGSKGKDGTEATTAAE